MKKALALVAVLGLVGSAAVAAPIVQEFPCNRDTGLSGYSSEVYIGTGARSSVCAAKAYQHQAVFDWDTDAIKAYIAANQPAGWPMVVELAVALASGVTAREVEVSTILGNDWIEGDGSSNAGPFLWSIGTLGATTMFAQTAYIDADGDPLTTGDRTEDPANSVVWTDGVNPVGSFRDIYDTPPMTNSVGLVYDGTEVQTDYTSCVLDAAVVDDLLNNALNRGLFMHDTEWGNMNVYMREQGGGSVAPKLIVTFVPEPLSLALLGFGGLGLLIRRKRS